MGSISIKTEHDRQRAIKIIGNADLPCTVTVTKGLIRSLKQNFLQRLWNKELEQQGDMTQEEYRALNKLTKGVPILRNNHPEFKEKYDRLIRPWDYEKKLELMMEPFDFPVTRLMTTKEHTQFLNDVYTYWRGKGYKLTDPDLQGIEVQ